MQQVQQHRSGACHPLAAQFRMRLFQGHLHQRATSRRPIKIPPPANSAILHHAAPPTFVMALYFPPSELLFLRRSAHVEVHISGGRASMHLLRRHRRRPRHHDRCWSPLLPPLGLDASAGPTR